MNTLAQWLRGLAEWLAPIPPPAAPIYTPYCQAASELIDEADKVQASGEYKRHQVYSRLIKKFPEARKRDLGFAIEQVLQDRP